MRLSSSVAKDAGLGKLTRTLCFSGIRRNFFVSSRRQLTICSGVSWARRCILETVRRFTSPGDNFGRTPCENSLASPKKLFFPVGFPEFFTGAGASSRGCWWNFRRVYPRTPGIREERNPKIGDCQSIFQIVDECLPYRSSLSMRP